MSWCLLKTAIVQKRSPHSGNLAFITIMLIEFTQVRRRGKPNRREGMSSAGDLTVIASFNGSGETGRNLSKRDIKTQTLFLETTAKEQAQTTFYQCQSIVGWMEQRCIMGARRKARDHCWLNRPVTPHLSRVSEGNREVPTWEKKMVLLSPYFITDNEFISPARNSRTSGTTTSDSIKKIAPLWHHHLKGKEEGRGVTVQTIKHTERPTGRL